MDGDRPVLDQGGAAPLLVSGYSREADQRSRRGRVQPGRSMRPSFCMFGLALAWLISLSAQAHSRGFAWFFAHSRSHETCSGHHVVATFCRRAADGEWSDIRSQRVHGCASHAAFRIAGNGDESQNGRPGRPCSSTAAHLPSGLRLDLSAWRRQRVCSTERACGAMLWIECAFIDHSDKDDTLELVIRFQS